MRTIIAGSRHVTDYAVIEAALASCGFADRITCVLSGEARGVDRLGEEWALAHGIPVERYPALWDEHGKAAGPIRNQQMAERADAMVAVWDGQSRGTADMIRRARERGLVVWVRPLDPPSRPGQCTHP